MDYGRNVYRRSIINNNKFDGELCFYFKDEKNKKIRKKNIMKHTNEEYVAF
jgi:hypothetical protein